MPSTDRPDCLCGDVVVFLGVNENLYLWSRVGTTLDTSMMAILRPMQTREPLESTEGKHVLASSTAIIVGSSVWNHLRSKSNQVVFHVASLSDIGFDPSLRPKHPGIFSESGRLTMPHEWRHGNFCSSREEVSSNVGSASWDGPGQRPRNRRVVPKSFFQARLEVFEFGRVGIGDWELERT